MLYIVDILINFCNDRLISGGFMMLSQKHVGYIAAVLVLCSVCITSCSSAPATTQLGKGNELAKWQGEWQSLSAVSGASQLNDAYTAQAEKMPFYNADGLKTAVSGILKTPILKAKFDGSNTVLLTVVNTDGKEQQIACEYRFTGKTPINGSEKSSWYMFEAVKPVEGLAEARYFIAVPPHRDRSDSLLHWHIRFGSSDIQSLVDADPLWWPTYIDAAYSHADVVKQFIPLIPELAGMLPQSSFAAYAGKWINTALIYDDKRPAVQNVYAQLIKEFAGKKDGSDFTKEEIIEMAKKSYGNAADFTHLEFITGKDKNELVVWKGSTELSRTAYMRDGANDLRASANAFMAADRQKAGKFAFLALTTPHGTPAHMHIWYGIKPSAIGSTDGAKPTCIPADSSEDLIARRVLSTCRKLLQQATKK